jgi:hypothetical protein
MFRVQPPTPRTFFSGEISLAYTPWNVVHKKSISICKQATDLVVVRVSLERGNY